MKVIFGIVLIGLLGSFSSNELDDLEKTQKNCNCELTETVKTYLTVNPYSATNKVNIKVLTQQEVLLIRNLLCMDIITATNFGFQEERFKKIILDGLGINENSENVNQVVSSFLNKYKQELVCPKDQSRKNSRDLHLYKTAILDGVIDLYDEILLNTDEYDIDFNAYEIVDGKKETVLDYIDKLIKTNVHGTEELELLKDDIIEAGAKRGDEIK
jgi:hypothetical protein